MSEAERIRILKRECYELYRFKDDSIKYEKAALKLETRVTELKLDDLISPLQLSFLLLTHEKPSNMSPAKFRRNVNELLKMKKTSFLFQFPQLLGFPDDYKLGHGRLLIFASLPRSVRDFAINLKSGRVGNMKTEREKIQSSFLSEMNIPRNPSVGSWLEVSESGISGFIMLENALREAEESLDILRILDPRIRIRLPQYAISINEGDAKRASFDPLEIELYNIFMTRRSKA